jgi:hypothetical protein
MAKITITIDRKGRAIIEADGFSGPACKDVTKSLEEALGGTKSEDLKSEFYEAEVEVDQEVSRG